MNKDQNVGFITNLETAQRFFERVGAAEKVMGPLTQDERLTILKTMAEPITLVELCDLMQGKRTLLIKHND